MTRILITGAGGMLGGDLRRALHGREVTALTRRELDITDAARVAEVVADHDVIVNCAAYTRVDDAESHEADAMRINGVAPGILADAAARTGARLVHISTDYVFDGHASSPYPEDTPRAPISAYGRTKAEGERRILERHPDGSCIVRTAWLYGADGPNFAKTMLTLAASKDTWPVVDDQFGQPTWTADLAAQLVRLIDAGAPSGVYHGTNGGRTTWFGFARAVLEEAGLDPDRITRTDSAAFIRPAPRPAYSVLGHDAWRTAGLEPMRDWRDALAAAWRVGALAG